jgi:2-oxoglutarate dehydrogenase E2 component (dihydrolipoamide succinyltransferase)
MATEVKSPTFPESVADGTIANWVKKEGETVQQDEVIAEIETDKVVLEVVAPFDGVISKIHKPAGEIVQSAELIAEFEKVSDHSADNEEEQHPEPTLKTEVAPEPIAPKKEENHNGPAATRLLKENNLASDDVVASGKGGRVTKADVGKSSFRIFIQSTTKERSNWHPAISNWQRRGEGSYVSIESYYRKKTAKC